jgi:prolyl oligopeptidase
MVMRHRLALASYLLSLSSFSIRRPSVTFAFAPATFSLARASSISDSCPSMSTTDTTESSTPVADAAAKEDPYIWLEDVESEESLNFAKDANEKCLKALGDPTKGPSYDRILKVLESQDRIPHVGCHGRNENNERVLFNFWKDEEHPKGIWRKTTEEEYKKDKPQWKTVLDVDKLAEEDEISWVWKGSSLLPRKRDPTNGKIVTRALLSLSRGGSDAVHLKEFDLITEDFVPEGEGFRLPEAKTRASYKSRDVLLVGSDFGEGVFSDMEFDL